MYLEYQIHNKTDANDLLAGIMFQSRMLGAPYGVETGLGWVMAKEDYCDGETIRQYRLNGIPESRASLASKLGKQQSKYWI